MANELTQYASLLGEIKTRIGQSQTRAAFAANREMLALYWDIGRLITERQTKEGWGASVVPRLSRDLRNELPGLKGFSEINLNRMLRFYNEYPCLFARRSPQSLSREVLIQSVKDIGTRLWYMQQTLEQGWRSRSASRSTSSPGPCPKT